MQASSLIPDISLLLSLFFSLFLSSRLLPLSPSSFCGLTGCSSSLLLCMACYRIAPRKSRRPLPTLPKDAQARIKTQPISFAWLIDDEKAELPPQDDGCTEKLSDVCKKSSNNSPAASSPKLSSNEAVCPSSTINAEKKDDVQKHTKQVKAQTPSQSKRQMPKEHQPEAILFTVLDEQAKSVDKALLVCTLD